MARFVLKKKGWKKVQKTSPKPWKKSFKGKKARIKMKGRKGRYCLPSWYVKTIGKGKELKKGKKRACNIMKSRSWVRKKRSSKK